MMSELGQSTRWIQTNPNCCLLVWEYRTVHQQRIWSIFRRGPLADWQCNLTDSKLWHPHFYSFNAHLVDQPFGELSWSASTFGKRSPKMTHPINIIGMFLSMPSRPSHILILTHDNTLPDPTQHNLRHRMVVPFQDDVLYGNPDFQRIHLSLF